MGTHEESPIEHPEPTAGSTDFKAEPQIVEEKLVGHSAPAAAAEGFKQQIKTSKEQLVVDNVSAGASQGLKQAQPTSSVPQAARHADVPETSLEEVRRTQNGTKTIRHH